MRLGVNAMFLEPQMGGVETYVRRLIPELLEARRELTITLFLNDTGREALETEPWSADVELVSPRLVGVRGVRALGEAVLLDPLARRRGCDLLHSVAMTAPLRPTIPSVVTIPDVTWLQVPGSVPPMTVRLWKTLVIPAARRARRLIAHSEAGRSDVAAAFAIPADRIDVVPHGPGRKIDLNPTPEDELRRHLALGEGPIVLAVSALLAHKNLSRLIYAMVRVRERVPNAVLVVPGNRTPLAGELTEVARGLGIADQVVLPGWTSAPDLEGLYRSASCFAFPSFREGFGLPVLEAMRRGLAVACANASAVAEVAGDAALLFDPYDTDEIAEVITRLLENPGLADELAERGKKRAALFSWRRAAEQTLASYHRALG